MGNSRGQGTAFRAERGTSVRHQSTSRAGAAGRDRSGEAVAAAEPTPDASGGEVPTGNRSPGAFNALAEAGHLIAWTMRADLATDGMPLWCGYTGQSAREVETGGWLKAVHPADRSEVLSAWHDATAAGSPFDLECRIRRRDGLFRAFRMRGVPIQPAGDAPGEWAIACTGPIEQQQRDEALQRSEREATDRARHLEAIVETMADGVTVMDGEGFLIYGNPAFRALLAVSTQPRFFSLPAAERWRRLDVRDEHGEPLPEQEWPPFRVLRGEVLTGASVAEVTMRALDGHDVLLSMSGAPVRDAQGHIIGGVVVGRDVTERRRLEHQAAEGAREAQVRASELAAIFESMADGILVYDREGRILRTNVADLMSLGLDAQPALYPRSVSERGRLFQLRDEHGQPLPEEQWPATRVLEGEVLRGASAPDIMLRVLDGRDVLFNISGAPVRDTEGQIVGGVLIRRDVTERRRQEQRTHETLEALLAMAETLVARQPEPAEAGSASQAGMAQRLAGLTAAVLASERVTIVPVGSADEVLEAAAVTGPMPEEERLGWQAGWPQQRHLQDFLPPDIIARLHLGELVLVDRSQPPFNRWPNPLAWRSLLIVPMLLGPQFVGVLTLDFAAEGHEMAPDDLALIGGVARLAALVLERERLLRERAEAHASALALQEANRRMDEFLGIATHELKTPVTSGMLNVGLAALRLQDLLEELPAREHWVAGQFDAMRGLMAAAEASMDRLSRLVTDLLDVSRIRAGRLDLRPLPCDLREIVREAAAEQRQLTPNRTIRLRLTRASVPVVADADRIGQVVTNYLTNALKYSAEDLPVEVRLHARSGRARVSVRDLGPGLPPAEYERVWERYYRAAGIQANPGTSMGLGLGLHISRTIIERHQGQVGVRSIPGQGSTFWFVLPLAIGGAAST
jgi:signal transduction histidine kinase/PAS domain-containing protein